MTIRMNRVPRHMMSALILGVVGASGSVAATAAAQSSAADARWQPWRGCWQPVGAPAIAQTPLECVVPAAGNSAVDLVTVANGKEVARQHIDAAGTPQPVTVGGCRGSETAQWSGDNRRVYERSTLACAGGLQRVSTAVMAMSPQGDWLRIESLAAGGGTGMRVMRYRDAGVPSNLPPDIARAIAGSGESMNAARIAAGAAIGNAAIVEATKHVDASVVQALLVERRQKFSLDGKQLLALADAGVPAGVTDMMVAVSYPDKFVVASGTGDAALATSADFGRGSADYGSGAEYPAYSCGYDPYGTSCGYSPYGSRYGYGYGYAPGYGYGYGSYGYGSYRQPYAIFVRGSEPGAPDAVAVKGQGYTQGGRSTTGGAWPTHGSATPDIGASPSGGTTSGGSGRTAKRRP